MNTRRFLLVLMFLSFATGFPARGAETMRTFRHDTDGFSIQFPSDWTAIPAANIQEITAAAKTMVGRGQQVEFRHGYQRDPGPPFPVYPYVLIQVNDRGRMRDRDLANMTKARAAMQKGLRTVEEKARSILSDARLGEPVYDTNAQIVWLTVEMQVADVGQVRGLTGMKMTEKGFIQVNCYALKREFDGFSDTFEAIIRSVDPIEALRYKPRRGGLAFLGGFKLGELGRNTLIGATVGGVVGLIFALRKRKKKPLPPPLP